MNNIRTRHCGWLNSCYGKLGRNCGRYQSGRSIEFPERHGDSEVVALEVECVMKILTEHEIWVLGSLRYGRCFVTRSLDNLVALERIVRHLMAWMQVKAEPMHHSHWESLGWVRVGR
jgi:hypothetical protein